MPTPPSPWLPLSGFRDRSVPKLDNLRRARAGGLRVPPTWWAAAADLDARADPAPPPAGGALIIRSGSPTEDNRKTSNAGQLLSLAVPDPADFGPALARVVAALPWDESGRKRGAVFVQPLVAAVEAGVAFFDGYYYEVTVARGSNQALTSGESRGAVTRGCYRRGEAWSAWLQSVYALFGDEDGTSGGRPGAPPGSRGDPRIDLEFARDAAGYVLLQVRPALFPVRRNPVLSLANHREILGDLPSPWVVSALREAGKDVLEYFAAIDPGVRRWDEAYAVEVGERAWMNFSFFFRLMDRWGLPRAMVTEGVGGEGGGPDDRIALWPRLLRAVPRLLRLQAANVSAVRGAPRALRLLDRRIAAAHDLPSLHGATVAALATAIRTNFAINGILSGVSRIRRALRVPNAARVVTQEMMQSYAALASVPGPSERRAALDRWLARYGHRGPLESDPARPRFAELRDVLLNDLTGAAEARNPPDGTAVAPSAGARPGPRFAALFRPFSVIDERREWFRDELMKRWRTLRRKILAEAERRAAGGTLDAQQDVFWLRGDDLPGPGGPGPGAARPFRESIAANRARADAARLLALPTTAPRDEIDQALARSEASAAAGTGAVRFPGIPLGPARVEGVAVKADDLTALLRRAGGAAGAGAALGPDTILVVPSLEPSWAVVFPRVGGVVAEIGGELSHASILLREAGKPAVVNCAGVYAAVRTGDRLRLDGARGVVEIVAREDETAGGGS